jgi:DNA polymerase-4
MSEEAYQAGVRKGMPLPRARRRCRDARLLHPHLDRYERAMDALRQRVLPFSPLVEAEEETGHLFLDLTGSGRLLGPAPDVAWRIRKQLRSELGLDPIWSVAPNKLVAKVATRVVKPDGEYIVEPGEEEEFLQPLPLGLLPGLAREELSLLRELNLERAGQVAALSAGQLGVALGPRAPALHRAARGIDPSPVLPAHHRPPCVRLDHRFATDVNDLPRVQAALLGLVERAGRALRERRQAARRVSLTVDYSDGARVVRGASDPGGVAGDAPLLALALLALERAWGRRVRLRHLRLTCDRLVFGPPSQLELFAGPGADDPQRQERLGRALDSIRQRFGAGAVRLGMCLPAPLRPAA